MPGYYHPSNSSALPPIDYEVMVFEIREGTVKTLEANERLDKQTDMDGFTWEQLGVTAWRGVQQVKLLGLTGKAYIKTIKGKKYIVFKGLPGSRPNLPGTIYARQNPKVSAFVVGSEEMVEDGLKTARLGIIVYAVVDVTKEVVSPPEAVPGQPPGFSLIDLGVHLSCDLLKFAAATALGVGVAIAVGVMFAGAVTLVVSVAAGKALDYLDNHYDLSDRLSKLCREWFWNNHTTQMLYRHGQDLLHHGEDWAQGEIKSLGWSH